MRALVIVDVQNDFLPRGALGVHRGDEVIPIINALASRFDLVVATQDWHPPNHESFAANHPGRKPGDEVLVEGVPQILWPRHCVQGLRGAQIADALDVSRVARVFQKGADAKIDSYSAFFDNAHRRSTGLASWLRERGVDEIWIAGLATDYCVLWSSLDARRLGFTVYVVQDACRGIDLHPGDIERAYDEMRTAGVQIVDSAAVPAEEMRAV